MKLKLIVTILFLGSAISAYVLWGHEYVAREIQAYSIAKSCETLQNGMSKKEAIEIIGNDYREVKVIAHPNRTRLVFPSPFGAETFTNIVVDNGTQKIVQIYCGE